MGKFKVVKRDGTALACGHTRQVDDDPRPLRVIVKRQQTTQQTRPDTYASLQVQTCSAPMATSRVVPSTPVRPPRSADFVMTVVAPKTPDKPLPSYVVDAEIASPHRYHEARFLDKENNPPNRRRFLETLRGKGMNTLTLGRSPEKDPMIIARLGLKPDAFGIIRVQTSTGEERRWIVHNTLPGTTKTNRLIPFDGPSVYPFRGDQLRELVDNYLESDEVDFEAYVEDHVRVARELDFDNAQG